MKVGDYVRTKKGIIGKIKLIDNQTELEDLYLVKRKWYYKEDFVKSSPNIIDLIEVGDYVNGGIVKEITKHYIRMNGAKELLFQFIDKDKPDEVKSIVTREMFESMEYKVKE